jgi:hypothetical protein
LCATLAVALAGALAAPAAGAGLEPVVPYDMRGHFAGFTRGIGNPDTRPGGLDFTDQVGSVLVGRANLTGRPVTVIGTLGPTGAVNLVGLDGLGLLTIEAVLGAFQPCVAPEDDTGAFQPCVAPDDDTGAFQPCIVPQVDIGGMQPCILQGRFRLISPLGRSQQGDLVAVHQLAVTGAPSIAGQWRGRLWDDRGGAATRAVEATFTQSASGAVTGRMSAVMVAPPEPEQPVVFDLVGQVGWDGTQGGYSLIVAGARGGVIAILNLQFERADDGSMQPCIVGPVRLSSSDGSARHASIDLCPVSA